MSNLPLYEAREIQPHFDKGNLGLWHTRFFSNYRSDWTLKKSDKEKADLKHEWIKKIAAKPCGDSDMLEAYAQRQRKLCEMLRGQTQPFKTTWNFVTGLGLSHPVENGLAWHHTLGVPYLAGSGVKGLLLAWVAGGWMALEEQKKNDLILRWFGRQKSDEKDQAGNLIFFDAVPVATPKLIADVMTPHYGDWYEQGHEIQTVTAEPEKIPADWHNPEPHLFLAVQEVTLQFGIAPRLKEAEREVKCALDELGKALEYLGAGAKTAVGYGRFQVDEKEQRRIEEKAQQEKIKQDEQRTIEATKLSPEEKALRNLQSAFKKAEESDNEKPGGELSELLSNTMKQAESGNWSARDKIALADMAEAIYKLIGWGSSKKKQEKKSRINQLRK